MAGPMLGGRGGRGGGRRKNYVPMSDINVTPFVDVMLVLLIVFMVAAPMLTVGVPVDLPKTPAASINDRVEPLTISVDSVGRVFLQETEITADQIVPRLQAITRNKADTTIFVRGDRGIQYGRVMEIMGMIAASGFSKVSLIAEMPDSGGRPAPTAGAPRPAAPR
jgi:biopolymer transport protein TolR